MLWFKFVWHHHFSETTQHREESSMMSHDSSSILFHNVLKKLFHQEHQNSSVCGKGFNELQIVIHTLIFFSGPPRPLMQTGPRPLVPQQHMVRGPPPPHPNQQQSPQRAPNPVGQQIPSRFQGQHGPQRHIAPQNRPPRFQVSSD